MKKAPNMILVIIISLLALVACTPQTSLTDELVSATLVTSDRTRALIADVDFDIAEVDVWKYTAKKADNGLTTGATTEQITLSETGETEGLSQGSWNFNLYGYKVETVENNDENTAATTTEKLICSGYVDNANVTYDDHTITITVKPSQTKNGTGNIVIDGGIEIADEDGNPYSKVENLYQYTKSISVYKSGTSNALESYENVASGVYKVVVTYTATTNTGKAYTAATGEKTFNVYDNLTTTVSGTVKESVQAAKITGEGVFSVDATFVIPEEDKALSVEVAATPLGTDVKINDTTTGKTTIEFPANSLKAADEGSTDVKFKVTTTSIETASSTYSVADNGATVAAFDFTLEGAEIKLASEENDVVEITTYVVPGLDQEKLSVKYVEDETDNTATITDYNPETGLLKFTVKHFSEYIVTTSEVIAYDHDSLYAAINEGKDVKLVCDITLKNNVYICIEHSMTIDFNGKTITRSKNNFLVGWYYPWDSTATVTFQNGTFNSKGESNPIIVMKTLVLENMTVNSWDATYSTAHGISISFTFSKVVLKNSTVNVTGWKYGIIGSYPANVELDNDSHVYVTWKEQGEEKTGEQTNEKWIITQ